MHSFSFFEITASALSFILKMDIPEPGNRESGETETAIPVKRKP